MAGKQEKITELQERINALEALQENYELHAADYVNCKYDESFHDADEDEAIDRYINTVILNASAQLAAENDEGSNTNY